MTEQTTGMSFSRRNFIKGAAALTATGALVGCAPAKETLAETGAEILLIPNGSPYHRGKPNLRLNLMVARVVETGLPLVYLNMVGGQDDQVFDGSSMVLNPGGRLMAQLPQFDETEVMVTFRRGAEGWLADQGEIISDEGAALSQRFGVAALSTLIIVDSDGQVTFRATDPDADTIVSALHKAGA